MSLTVTPTNPSIALGTIQHFTATGTYSDNSTQDLTKAVTWSSSYPGIATISNAAGSNGVATSVATGATTIVAALGTVSGSTILTVTPATLVSLTVTPTNPSIALGTLQHFTATGTYSDNSTQDLTKAVTWSSSYPGIATISNAAGSNGSATSVTTGVTTIQALSGSILGSTTLTITAATLESIAVSPSNPSIAIGASQVFTAMGLFTDNTTQDMTASVTWSSANSGIATISNAAGSNGLATAVGAGTTAITCVSGNVSGAASLTVADAGVVTLSWDGPTTNTDGSSLNPITDISIYKIYYGAASNTYTQVVTVANPGTTTITQTLSLPPGTYYFVVTDVDISGQESGYSNEVVKTI
ncbi:MAG TPA: Ig-like domain-containing protein [Nitrospirota bacterium]|nr:Ig-like domain-containing protein [Nitrospirota bacterium]